MSIDGRVDAADRKNSAALSKFENKWGAGAETAKERAQMAADQKNLTKSTKATTANAISTGRKQLADQQRALASKKATTASKKTLPGNLGAVKKKPPVMSERTGNPSDPKDWTNAPGNAAFAEQLRKANGGK